MTRILKGTAVAALIGAAALASVTPSEARNRWIGPAAAGFAAGAIVGCGCEPAPTRYGGPLLRPAIRRAAATAMRRHMRMRRPRPTTIV